MAYILFPEDGFWSDLALFASWAHSLAYHGSGQFYEIAGFADYPAGYLAVLWLLGVISLRISPDDVFLTRFLIKLAPILADVALALATYFAAQRVVGARGGVVAAGIYLFSPISWFDSAIWGQIDSVGALALTWPIQEVLRMGASAARAFHPAGRDTAWRAYRKMPESNASRAASTRSSRPTRIASPGVTPPM